MGETSRAERGFQLDSKLLGEYPEMANINERASDDISEVSQVHINGETIDAFIGDIEAGEPTGDVEYLLQMVEDGLRGLDALNKPEYGNFIKKEREKLEERKIKATKAIGDKKRNIAVGDGRYL